MTRSRLPRRSPGRLSRRATRRPARRLLAVAALALAAAVGGTACQPVLSGAAVVMGGERVSEREMDQRVTEVTEQREREGQQAQPAAAITQEQVRQVILSRVLDEAAKQVGVTVTQAEIDQQRSTLEQRAGGPEAFAKQVANANIVPGELDNFLRSLILEQKIAEALVPQATSPEEQQQRSEELRELVTGVMEDLDIKVNPRYGRWNPDQFSIEPAFPGYVKPENEAAPTPGAPGAPESPGTPETPAPQ